MSYKWRLAYKEDGIIGLQDSKKQFSGRALVKTLTPEQLVERKDTEIKYLKAEIEMLKKLDKEERQVIKKNKKLKPCFIFQLIKSVADKISVAICVNLLECLGLDIIVIYLQNIFVTSVKIWV